MDQTGCHTTEKIEGEISNGTKPVFDVISEDIKKPHVHDNMEEPSVKEHGTEKRKVLLNTRKVSSKLWAGVSERHYPIEIKDFF
jgi:hypothetical protein